MAKMCEALVRRLQRRLGEKELSVLDAGCGTGEQTLGVARAFPEAHVTGIDLSAASIEFARALAVKRGIRAVFERRNLTESLSGLGRFDMIVSVGTLHHLREPRAGLERLREVIVEHGALVGMMYGRFGWQQMQWTRDALVLLGGEGASREARLAAFEGIQLGTTKRVADQIETFWRRRRFGPAIGMAEAARRVAAGRDRAFYADALTHVQEATFTWAELIDLLQETGWSFTGWPSHSGIPDSPEQIFRGAALISAQKLSQRELAGVYERLLRPPCLYFIAETARDLGS